jgi:hypothetical protein
MVAFDAVENPISAAATLGAIASFLRIEFMVF